MTLLLLALGSEARAEEVPDPATSEEALRYLVMTAGFDEVAEGPAVEGDGGEPGDLAPLPSGEEGDPDMLHEEMPEGSLGGAEHPHEDVPPSDTGLSASTAFVLTLIDLEGRLEAAPSARIGEKVFQFNDEGVPPDVIPGDQRWCALVEHYSPDHPVEILEGTRPWGRVSLGFEGEGSAPGLEVRLTGDGISHSFQDEALQGKPVPSHSPKTGAGGSWVWGLAGVLLAVAAWVGFRWFRRPYRSRRR